MADGALNDGDGTLSTDRVGPEALPEQPLFGPGDGLDRNRMQLPPRYSGAQNLVPPPHYEDDAHSLSRDHVGHYLLFLAAINKLRSKLSGLTEHNISLAKHLSTEERWGLFVQMAVNRFGVWQSAVIERHSAFCCPASQDATCQHAFLPPPDVLMVWAAYLQCPTKYSSFTFV